MMVKMKKINILLLLLIGFWSFISCGKEEDSLPESDTGTNNSISIQAYSRFNNEKLFKANDYAAAISQIRSKQNSVVLLHRVDATISSTEIKNTMVTIAEETVKIPVFAWTRYADTQIEGSGILVGQTITEMKSIPTSDGCCYVSVPLTVTGGTSMNFSSITFENETQLATGIAEIKANLDDKTVLIGFAAKSLQNKLKTEFSGETYRFETMESSGGNTTQFLFLLTNQKWKLEEYKETAVGTDGISCIDLKIEKL